MFTLFTPGIDTYVLDVVGLIRELQAGSPDNGFTELGTSPACNDGAIICEDRAQAEQDSFIFYDFVHLTTATNSRVAGAAAELVKAGAPTTPIPLPASLWFMVSAMGGIALLGRLRRRAA